MHHFLDFTDAKPAAVATVRAKVRKGWRLCLVSHGFGAAGGSADYSHALVGPAGELFKVSRRTVAAAAVEVAAGELELGMQVLILEGVFKTQLTLEASRRGLAKAEDLGARWNVELRRWMIRPEAASNFAQWLSPDAQPTHMFPSLCAQN